MSSIRFNALMKASGRELPTTKLPKRKISTYFGSHVFDKKAMQEYLSKEAYENVIKATEEGGKLSRQYADQVASGMKSWATDRGATHYTHWFQPLNELTAEKHDAFFEPSENGSIIENFKGALLIQQEPDASSFPSGGLRNTFEARGYTAWDPSSPAFIVDHTLCIPTIFISYTSEALDYKTPLLKSLQVIDNAATQVCKYFDASVKKVFPTLGWEQEYFLIDEAFYHARPDLTLTGRTLLGHSSAKDQQLEDHYFGSIPQRVTAYIRDFETEALKLGIPVKTRHNEVAPNQFECAPSFEEANLAVDHNQLLMDIMQKVAIRHKFRVLLHEKPFKGVNGSGKHNNWSLMTDTGVNLLSPSKTPQKNLRFLTFLVNIIKAVDEHSELQRASIASAGNAHRLGANEAPPSIMSVFIGKQLTNILNEIEARVPEGKMTPGEKAALNIDIGKIPEILLDNTDRNRTSPFAFTGNRFEFRAVGSSANCASPVIALNTAIADQLIKFKNEVDHLVHNKIKKDEAILQVLRDYIASSKKVRFEGNGYAQEWVLEAEKRGLSNITDVPTALQAFITTKTKAAFEMHKILTGRELEARFDIKLHNFANKIQIESRVLADLATNHVIPVVIKYQNILLKNISGLKKAFSGEDLQPQLEFPLKTLSELSYHISEVRLKVDKMLECRKEANTKGNIHDKASAYSKRVLPMLEKIRCHLDKLEMIVDNEIWPLPKYREMLFIK